MRGCFRAMVLFLSLVVVGAWNSTDDEIGAVSVEIPQENDGAWATQPQNGTYWSALHLSLLALVAVLLARLAFHYKAFVSSRPYMQRHFQCVDYSAIRAWLGRSGGYELVQDTSNSSYSRVALACQLLVWACLSLVYGCYLLLLVLVVQLLVLDLYRFVLKPFTYAVLFAVGVLLQLLSVLCNLCTCCIACWNPVKDVCHAGCEVIGNASHALFVQVPVAVVSAFNPDTGKHLEMSLNRCIRAVRSDFTTMAAGRLNIRRTGHMTPADIEMGGVRIARTSNEGAPRGSSSDEHPHGREEHSMLLAAGDTDESKVVAPSGRSSNRSNQATGNDTSRLLHLLAVPPPLFVDSSAFLCERNTKAIRNAKVKEDLPTSHSKKMLPPHSVSNATDSEHKGLSISKMFTRTPTSACIELAKLLPSQLQGYSWKLAYASYRDGSSLNTLYERLRKAYKAGCPASVVIVVKEAKGNTIGAFLSLRKPLAPLPRFTGGVDTFVFQLHPELKVFRHNQESPTSAGAKDSNSDSGNGEGKSSGTTNNYFVLATYDALTVGCGNVANSDASGNSDPYDKAILEGCALRIGRRIRFGESRKCPTFASEVLSNEESFVLDGVEAWVFK